MLISSVMKLIEVILVLVLNMSVFMFGIRISKIITWSQHSVPIIVTSWWILHLLLALFLREWWQLSLFSFCSLFAIMNIVEKIGVHRQRRRHLPEILFLLNLFILQIRSGKSLRSVLAEALHVRKSSLSLGVLRALEVVAFSQHGETKFKSALLQKFVFTLSNAVENGHHARHLLENLRDELSLLKYFRHKSGQATLQTRMQSYICLFLYMILAVVLLKWLGPHRLKPFVTSSLAMMVLGVVIMNRLGRKKKWKV